LIHTFKHSLIRDRAFLLNFLYYKDVPPDNNSSEKAIRNAKIKANISGSFKSLQHDWVVMRSIIDSAIKNNLNILDTLFNIEIGNEISFLPPE